MSERSEADLTTRQNSDGNGAREALLDILKAPPAVVDKLLAELWIAGFKIVPLDGGEEPEALGFVECKTCGRVFGSKACEQHEAELSALMFPEDATDE